MSIPFHDFFVTLDVSNKVRNLLESNSSYYHGILNQMSNNTDTINDIYDGQFYEKFVQDLPESHRKSYVTSILNSDGALVFKSSKFSVWSIQIILYDLPVNVRNNNPITVRLWFGDKKPDTSIFFKPFVDNVNKLSTKGIDCQFSDGMKTIRLYVICCCVNSVARAPMRGLIFFNGYFGCN